MRNVVMTLALVGVLALLAAPVQATLVTVNSSTVFFDNFEGPAVGNAPVAVTGTWGTVGNSVVTDAVSPGAFEGDQYLVYSADQGPTGQFISGTSTDDILHWELMVNQPMWTGTPTNGAYIRLQDSGTLRIAVMLITGGVVNNLAPADEGGWTDTGLSWSTDTWEKYEIDYVAGADTFDLTVDGGTSVTLSARAPGNIDELKLRTGSGATTYIDAVPEPSTLALLGMGLIGLLCYAWRKRK